MKPKITNAPKRIFLVMDTDGQAADFKYLRGVSWCEDRINKTDIEYILEEELERYRKVLESITSSMSAHPDCTEGSEFADMVSIARKLLSTYRN